VTRPGIVTVMAKGFVMIRRSAFEQVGAWTGSFFLYREGVDLARLLRDRGYHGSADGSRVLPTRTRY
jgi:GT2 family glycosyltransferase